MIHMSLCIPILYCRELGNEWRIWPLPRIGSQLWHGFQRLWRSVVRLGWGVWAARLQHKAANEKHAVCSRNREAYMRLQCGNMFFSSCCWKGLCVFLSSMFAAFGTFRFIEALALSQMGPIKGGSDTESGTCEGRLFGGAS